MQYKALLLLLTLSIAIIFVLWSSQDNTNPKSNIDTKDETSIRNCVPAFADGGGPYYQPNSPFRENLAPTDNSGERLIVSGKVLRSDCVTPVGDAIIDIWQANESGDYDDTWYRGKVKTDSEGEYKFETVVPKGYGEGTGYRPPHIHFKVFVGDQEIITSQIFFPEVRGREGFSDEYIMTLETENSNVGPIHKGSHDIILP